MVSRIAARRVLLVVHLGVLIAVAVVMTATPGCPGSGCALGAAAQSHSAVVAPPPGPVQLSMTPAPGATGVDPLAPVTVTAAAGGLLTVRMVNDAGKPVEGVTTPDETVWKPTVPLGYGRTYTVTAIGRGADHVTRALVSSFTTLVPGNQTAVRLTTTGNQALVDGATYGVGTVVVARFDEPIPDRAAAQSALRVSTDPPLEGAWTWVDDQTAHWRPQHYYPPGATVRIAADIYGVPLGSGLYGQADAAVSFRIGDAHISVANDITKQVSVFSNGTLMRTMPTSMGMGGSETIGGRTISFWTQPGIYTVMDKANPVIMDSSTYGLPINSRLGYKETINWATRISTDGIYLHQLEDTVWAQGNTNVSHGCLNLNADNARWFYDFSQPGDVVEIIHTGGAPLQLWQNGDWSVPWPQWLAGGAAGPASPPPPPATPPPTPETQAAGG
ncbi:MAG TPA: Ig-like domain-containing protein [Mycobacterium sp.]|nr:Ig-like domain-containing protein [Mycobacterium sp.]HPZ95322.1 Ig-like domain-containing protein [Mycobacterium sp.]